MSNHASSKVPVALGALARADVVGRQRRRPLLGEEVDELGDVEGDEVVAGDDDEVVVHVLAVDQLRQRADDAELLGLGAGVLDGDGRLLEVGAREVRLELLGEALVRGDEHLVDPVVGLQIPEDLVDDSAVTDRKQHLRPITRDRPEPRRVSACEHNCLHATTVTPDRQGLFLSHLTVSTGSRRGGPDAGRPKPIPAAAVYGRYARADDP